MTDRVMDTIAAFDAARDWRAYETAKRLAAKLGPVGQLAIVDSAIAARRRIGGK